MVHLRLDFFPAAVGQRGHVNLVVKVPDVADDGLVFHGRHVGARDDAQIARGADKDVGFVGRVFHGHHAVAFHRGLQCVDGVDFRHPHLRRERAQGLGRAFAHVAITAHQGDLAGHHHVGRALDGVDQAFAAAIQVVELALGHRVVHVDGAKEQRALGAHLVQAVHAGGGFFGHTDDLRALACVPSGVCRELGLDGGKENGFLFAARLVQHRDVLLGALAQVHQERGVAAIVQDHVGAFLG